MWQRHDWSEVKLMCFSVPSLRNLLGIRRLGQDGVKMRRAWSHRARFFGPGISCHNKSKKVRKCKCQKLVKTWIDIEQSHYRCVSCKGDWILLEYVAKWFTLRTIKNHSQWHLIGLTVSGFFIIFYFIQSVCFVFSNLQLNVLLSGLTFEEDLAIALRHRHVNSNSLQRLRFSTAATLRLTRWRREPAPLWFRVLTALWESVWASFPRRLQLASVATRASRCLCAATAITYKEIR